MKLSVIIPQAASDPRGRFEFIESWCQQVGVHPDDYEVVVAVNDRDASAVRQCRELVRPQDQVVEFHGENEMHYYEAGVDAARGQLLLLTENHVVADKKCVAEILAFFERTESVGAFLKAKHINENRFSRHEGEVYDRQVKEVWLQPDCWDQVHLRGFVIDRDVLKSAGGISWQYELFCPRLLSLRLHRQAIRIDYCSEAVIYHVNVPGFSFLQDELRNYVTNEVRYGDEQDSTTADFELGSSDIVEHRKYWQGNLIEAGASRLFQTVLTKLTTLRDGRPAISWLRLLATAVRWRIFVMLGPSVMLWSAGRKLLWSRIRYGVLQYSRARGNYAFEQLWDAIADFERARYCVPHPVSEEKIDPLQAAQFGDRTRILGFHAGEQWQGKQFRWSEPVAMLCLEIESEHTEICIDTGSIRGAECEFPFEFYLNGKRIDRSGIHIEQGEIRLGVTAEYLCDDSRQHLLLLTKPIGVSNRHSKEHRQLGMPVVCVSVKSASRAMRPETKAA